MSSIIKLEGIDKTFQCGKERIKVLDNINLEVTENQFVSIMGPSGCGKSTLLYLLGGLDKPTNGTIKINDRDINNISDIEKGKLRRQELGFVFQFYNLVQNLSVEENILLPIIMDNKKEGDYENRLLELLDIIGLSHKRKHTPRELSGGQQQRVAIARSLINDPPIILADEPIGNLDSKNGIEIMTLFRKINKENNKVIIQVTHSMEAAKFGNRIIFLKDGQITNEEYLEKGSN